MIHSQGLWINLHNFTQTFVHSSSKLILAILVDRVFRIKSFIYKFIQIVFCLKISSYFFRHIKSFHPSRLAENSTNYTTQPVIPTAQSTSRFNKLHLTHLLQQFLPMLTISHLNRSRFSEICRSLRFNGISQFYCLIYFRIDTFFNINKFLLFFINFFFFFYLFDFSAIFLLRLGKNGAQKRITAFFHLHINLLTVNLRLTKNRHQAIICLLQARQIHNSLVKRLEKGCIS